MVPEATPEAGLGLRVQVETLGPPFWKGEFS